MVPLILLLVLFVSIINYTVSQCAQYAAKDHLVLNYDHSWSTLWYYKYIHGDLLIRGKASLIA